MTIETRINGKAEEISSAAAWLSSSVASAVSASTNKFSSAKLGIGSEWEGATASAIIDWLGEAVNVTDSLTTRIADVSSALSRYSDCLSVAVNEAEWIRQDAISGGLKVSGTLVLAPDDSADAEKNALYNSLSARMEATRVNLSASQQDLRTSLTPDDVKNTYQVFSAVLEISVNSLSSYVDAVIRQRLVDESIRLTEMADDLTNSIIARYSQAVPLAVRGQSRMANNSLNYANSLKMRAGQYLDDVRHVDKGLKALRIAGVALPFIGTGVGMAVDYANGEGLTQVVVSNVAATVAGTIVGTAAGSAAGTAIGTAICPGVGTVAGFVVGTGVGFVVSTFTDETVDSLLEDKQGIVHAAEEGLNAVVPDAISDNVREDVSRMWSDIKEGVTEINRRQNRAG